MGLFEEIFGMVGLARRMTEEGLARRMTEEQLKAQNAAQQQAQQYDPARAVLMQNLQMLIAMHPYLTPEERDQINALAQSVVGRLGMQQALPPQRNPEV